MPISVYNVFLSTISRNALSVSMSGTGARPLTLTGDGVSASRPRLSQITGRPPSLALNPPKRGQNGAKSIHHNHGQIWQLAAKQTFSLLRELKMAANTARI